jgi:hypothetical protein
MVFRRMPDCSWRASDLITAALESTYRHWRDRYGELPTERLRTEIKIAAVKSRNPGYSYLCAGFERDRIVRGKLYLWAPLRDDQRDSAPHALIA